MREGYQLEVRAFGRYLFPVGAWWGQIMDDLTTSELAVSPLACVPPAMKLIGERMIQSVVDPHTQQRLRLI